MLAIFETLNVTFLVLGNVPMRYWEYEFMCTLNVVINSSTSNYASRKGNGLINEIFRKIRDYFDLNNDKLGFGCIRGHLSR